jgi:hypothetical protein
MHSESSELIIRASVGFVNTMGVQREAETTFDWFKSYKDVAHLLRPALPDKTVRILMLGCGNSTLSEDVRPHYVIFARVASTLFTPPSRRDEMLRCTTTDTKISSMSTCARATTTTP